MFTFGAATTTFLSLFTLTIEGSFLNTKLSSPDTDTPEMLVNKLSLPHWQQFVVGGQASQFMLRVKEVKELYRTHT